MAILAEQQDSAVIPYPPAAREKNIGGVVEATFVIVSDGSVSEVKIEQADYPELTDGLTQAIRTIRYQPGAYRKEARLHLFFDPNHPERPLVIRRGAQVLR